MNALPRGAFYRRVVAIPEPGRVRAAVEDESHRMDVTLIHDGQRVADIQSVMHRMPWNTCPGATEKLKELVGLTFRRMSQTTGYDAKEHCTHLFDLARLAMARALLNTPVQYDISVADRIDTQTRGEILRDGRPFMAWDVRGWDVTGPAPFAGHSLHGAPVWPAGLDDDAVEAALVLRRVFMVAQIRGTLAAQTRAKMGVEAPASSFIRTAGMVGRCFSFQERIVDQASPMKNWRNFAERREELLAGFSGARTIAEMTTANSTV